MFTGAEIIPEEELAVRRARCLALLRKHCPQAGGLMIFSKVNIYYFTGTFAPGLFWLPLEGVPALAVRKALERAELESPSTRAFAYKNYGQIPDLLAGQGSPLPPVFAVEQEGLSWSLGLNFSRNFKNYELLPADMVIKQTRAVKTPWEAGKLRLAGRRHYQGMCEIFPQRVRVGMDGAGLSRLLWDIMLELGHSGHIRMSAHGEESFLGHVAVGENSAYPSYYNGPLGFKGAHPAAGYMGYAGEVWTRDSFLATDVGFVLEGYNSDKSVFYFAGPPSSIPAPARRVQDACLEIQREIAARLKPGTIPQDLYRLGLDLAARHDLGEGFLGMGGNKVPFIGHGLGLQLDEWPALAERFTEPLQENMFLAVEPKVVVPGLGMLGVENSFLVTPDGGFCLTNLSGRVDTDDAGDIICVGA
ncbi:MAG: Xaa-Pro peptidase family protein [Desulfovibrionaceae bacterium]|nr:Xaa-Pro peptidase family protein [Desulfovibrionaceae bacterium]